MKNRGKWTSIFAGVQATGLFCMFAWQWAPAVTSSFLWGAALIALFPGNFAGAIFAEKLFWNSGLSQAMMLLVEIPVLIICNAALWFCVIIASRRLLRRERPSAGTITRT
jgi:hypothetical protein